MFGSSRIWKVRMVLTFKIRRLHNKVMDDFRGGVAPNPVELQQKGNIKRHSIPLKAWLVRSGSKLTVLINHLGAGKSHCAESYDKQK